MCPGTYLTCSSCHAAGGEGGTSWVSTGHEGGVVPSLGLRPPPLEGNFKITLYLHMHMTISNVITVVK